MREAARSGLKPHASGTGTQTLQDGVGQFVNCTRPASRFLSSTVGDAVQAMSAPLQPMSEATRTDVLPHASCCPLNARPDPALNIRLQAISPSCQKTALGRFLADSRQLIKSHASPVSAYARRLTAASERPFETVLVHPINDQPRSSSSTGEISTSVHKTDELTRQAR